MRMTRRTAIASALLSPALLLARANVRVGVCDWSLKKGADIGALALAKDIGFEGVEVSLGRNVPEQVLPLDAAVLQSRYITMSRDLGIKLTSTCLDVLHVHVLKSDPLAPKLISDAIRISRAMGAPAILLPSFGPGAISGRDEMSRVSDILKPLMAEAERARIVLALENTLSAEDNAFIMDRVGSNNLKVYYDIANSHYNGYDVPKEIEWLGKQRIALVHFKERGYLGSGQVPIEGVVSALHKISYQGFINLELGSPSGDLPADMRRNLAYTRKVMTA
jgi:L-ribulose-5-phosphate 3-epimerase